MNMALFVGDRSSLCFERSILCFKCRGFEKFEEGLKGNRKLDLMDHEVLNSTEGSLNYTTDFRASGQAHKLLV